MEKNIIINNEEIKIDFWDNNAKDTLVCIHGIFSNKNFIGDLKENAKTFNVISFSYGNLKKMDYENIKKIIEIIVFKLLRRTKIHILAHSLGAIFASDIGRNYKIKKIYLINPIHPYILKYRWFKILTKYVHNSEKVNIKNKLIDFTTPKLEKILPPNFYKFLNRKSNWYNIIQKTIINENVIQNKLKKNLIEIKNKSEYIISNIDKIISKEHLINFLNNIKKEYILINSENHSPLLNNSCFEIIKILNKNNFRKRFFLNKKIFKW